MLRSWLKIGLFASTGAVIWAGCTDKTGLQSGADEFPPTITITLADTLIDISEGLIFTVTAQDNISLLTFGWTVSGVATATRDTTFDTTTPEHAETVTITGGLIAGTITIIATATDGAGNAAVPDTVNAQIVVPTVAFVIPDPIGPALLVRVGDSLRVGVQMSDIQGLSSVELEGVALRGDSALGTDVIVQRFDTKLVDDLNGITDTLVLRDLLATVDETAAESVLLRAIVIDLAGNSDTAFATVEIVAGPRMKIVDPLDGSQVPPGFTINISINGLSDIGIKEMGFFTTGVLVTGDTLPAIPLSSRQNDTTHVFTLLIPAATPLGTMTVIPFGRDGADQLGTGDPITIDIVAAAGVSDTIPPLVVDSVQLRVEVDDSVFVRGTDLGGVVWLGYILRDDAGTVVSGDSLSFSGTGANEQARFEMFLSGVVTTFPTELVLTAFGVDNVGNRGASSFDLVTPIFAPGQADTLTVVAGITEELPLGGTVADAIYNRNLNEFYLTNIDRDRLEVFDVATSAFVANIPIGSRPYGISLWPADTLGNHADSVIIANSGGTNISIVDVSAGVRQEVRRHRLPNFIIQSVDTRLSETGAVEFDIVEHDFSDRPQFLGMVCRATTATTNCAADSIIAVYSTTPTPGQGIGPLFPNRGTVRWENLTAGVPESHFFWEHAATTANEESDTLQVIAHRGRKTDGNDSLEVLLHAAKGVMVAMADLSFRDSTFVRNSGNFARAFIGEGGTIQDQNEYARVLNYIAAFGVVTSVDTAIIVTDTLFGPSITDLGISPGIEVRDFISNTSTRIKAIGINFNGLTNLVRADSIYVLNGFARLTGTISSGAQNFGMDLNFDHAFDADLRGTAVPGDSDTRLLFSAVDTPEVVAFDTWHFGEVARIPIRDPIIGPLRVARITATNEQFLIGVTSAGVVTVRMPAISNLFLTPDGFTLPGGTR